MKKILILSLLLIALVFPKQLYAASVSEVEVTPAVDDTAQQEYQNHIDKLEAFLIHKKSPFALYAKELVDSADKYGLPDYRLIAAISGVESNFGRFIPPDSYNAVGWVNGAFQFKSWPDMFDKVAQTLKESYYDRGLDTVEKIAPVYAPPSTTWAGHVQFFIKDIEDFQVDSSGDQPEFTL